jgi:ComF family protein
VFKRLLTSRFNLPFPLPSFVSQCAVCRSWPAQQVCAPCVSRFSPQTLRCTACALDLPPDLSLETADARTSPRLCVDCIRHPPPVDNTLVAVTYAYPWSELITRYKFGNRPGWAPFFADLLLGATGVRPVLEALLAEDLIIPMPLSAERLQLRGFNQAWALTTALARQAGTPARLDARLLLRVKHTQPQTTLHREARLANVRNAFQPDPLRASLLAGRRVVLVDDVMTSGASLFTAAEALRAAGAAHITAIALARTPAT